MGVAYSIRRGLGVGLPVPETSFEKLGPMLPEVTYELESSYTQPKYRTYLQYSAREFPNTRCHLHILLQ